MAESLDLTRVQHNDEASKFEDEKSILLAEHKENLKVRTTQLLELMKEMGVKIEPSAEDDDNSELGSLIQAIKVAFQNFEENKTALQQLIDEREEIAREKEDLGFQLAGAHAQLDLWKNKFEKSDAGKLSNQVDTLTEESKELKNDFFIKFQSFSQEIDTLRSQLKSQTDIGGDGDSGDQLKLGTSVDSAEPVTNGSNGASAGATAVSMETSREYRSKYNLDETKILDDLDVTKMAETAADA